MDEWHTNQAAIASAIAGDREALRAVWADHRRWVAAILLAHKSRESDLEDLLQTVALHLCRKVREVRDPEAFRPWLRMVAVNTARAEGRARTRSKRGFLRLVARTTPEPGDGTDTGDPGRAERARRLLTLAEQLPDGYREPLLMRCVSGMSHRQIGAAMGLPETTVETRIARGRRMLRDLASGEQETEPAAASV